MQYEGVITITKFGTGFVNCLDGTSILIPKENINYAINRDNVKVEIINKTDKGVIGNIISFPSFIGKTYIAIISHFHGSNIYAYVEEIGKKNLICLQYKQKVKINDYLFIKINKILSGTVLQYIGNFSNDCFKYKFNLCEISCDLSTLQKNSLYIDRKDLTNHNVFTIDPISSKDLDDAFSVMLIDEVYHIYIHIADVSEYIHPGLPFFESIMERGNTIYGIDYNWPMIPRELSDDMCSLHENKKRYAITNEFIYDKNGLNHIGMYYSIVESKKQYTYEEVDILLENKKNNDINVLYESSKVINNILDMFPMNLMTKPSHKTVELYMLLTNKVMGEMLFLKKSGNFRFHPKPYNNQLQTLKRYLGLTNNLDRSEILKKCNNICNYTYEYIIKDIMRKAEYVACKNEHSHYALGINHYIHFTSPIRRASDLLNHLIIKGYKFSDDEIEKYCTYFNKAEIIQMSVENMILRNDLMIYLYKLVGQIIDVVIINISNTGIKILLSNGIYYYEDDIHISKLSNSKLFYNNIEYKLENETHSYKLFDTIKICIDSELAISLSCNI